MKIWGPEKLLAFSLFGGVVSAAGLPIYIYAPPYYAQNFGLTLTAIAAVLFWLRLFDAVQDPLFGWISENLGSFRPFAVVIAAFVMSISMIGLFGVNPLFSPLWWFALNLIGLFSSFSFLTINFYAQGIQKAKSTTGGHFRVAAWRETGALLGICIAAVAPAILANFVTFPYVWFAVGFAGCVALAAAGMHDQWLGDISTDPTPFKEILKDAQTRRLLLLALVNAMPVAVSSTLFLFFVIFRLDAPGWEGPLLVLFFLSGAFAAPLWTKASEQFGGKKTLLSAMVLAVCSFCFALFLSQGDQIWFALICIASGASIGADLTILPALFAAHLAKIAPSGGQGFGLWSFVNKSTLAFAAIILFPLLEVAGFDPTLESQPQQALTTLTIFYAALPLTLKLLAVCLLVLIRIDED